MLFTADRHELLAGGEFSEPSARHTIARIVERAQRDVDPAAGLWPRDPSDGGEGRAASLYWGAAGIAWALDRVAPGSADDTGADDYERRLREDADDPDFGWPGVWFGAGGAIAVAESRAPDAARRDRLFELARASLESPALEPMMGHPGFMALAAELHAQTGEQRWADFWREGADRLFREWLHDAEHDAWVWTQTLAGHESRYLGAAHGCAGTAHVLLRGGALLPADRRAEVESRVVATFRRFAVVESGRANWPTGAGDPLVQKDRIRVQWCHGAAGVVTSLWTIARDDEAWTDLLLAAGRLIWEAGPIRGAPGLCHGTAGNAYALLALWARTSDEEWLDRARLFAQHAAAQTEERARPHHSLFTGDEGVAMCLASCLDGDARFPVADGLFSSP